LMITLRTAAFAALLCLCGAATSSAQDAAPGENGDAAAAATKSYYLARTGESLNGPYIDAILYLEFFQIRKKWIYPDLGYVDFAHDNDREIFIGGGRTLVDGKIAAWEQELLYVQALGPADGGARYLQPFSLLRVRFTRTVTNETEYFAYLPWNDSAHTHQVIERAKFE
jgi:hypothetical protein